MKKLLIVLSIILFTATAWAGNIEMPKKQFQQAVTVTSTAADILPLNEKGRYVLIQNNDSTGIVYLNLSGDATVSDTMFRLKPGDSLELFNIINAVSAIGSIASNANVAVTEGR